MKEKSFSVDSTNFDVNGGSRGSTIIIHDLSLGDIIDFYGIGTVLEEIGWRAAANHFDLTEKE